jgi:hypothetical protein
LDVLVMAMQLQGYVPLFCIAYPGSFRRHP